MLRLAAIAVFFLSLSCKESIDTKSSHTLYSKEINDSFTIEFRKPLDFSANKQYTIVYVLDGSIGLGDYVLAKDSSWMAQLPSNCIIATVGHIGDYHSRRRRDFIPSDEGAYSDKDFGHAAQFYSFLKSDIIPFVDNQFPSRQKKVLIGHSFSGLFCLYTAMQNESLFDEYFAISPSVWANDNELLKIEESFSKKHSDFPASIHLFVGGLEVFNKVLSSTNNWKDAVGKRNYKSLSVYYEEIATANHYSVRKPAIDRILNSLSK